jgi:diamine N-acetyltransferase
MPVDRAGPVDPADPGDPAVRLVPLEDADRAAVLALRLGPGQRRFVSDVPESLAEAAAHPEGNPWPRAVYAGAEPVGFVMLSWDVTPSPPELLGPWFLWKLLVDERHQGRGYGAAAVRLVAGVVTANGGTELLTSHVPGPDGPAGFYARLGFVPTGEVDDAGETIVGLRLS